MNELITKILDFILSEKRALQGVISAITVFFVWPHFSSLGVSKGIPVEVYGPFIVIFSVCCGVLAVFLLEQILNLGKLSRNYILNKRKLKLRKIQQENTIRLALPNLPKEQMEILYALNRGPQKLHDERGGIFWLQRNGYIDKLASIEINYSMYKISEFAQEELKKYIYGKDA